MLQQAGVRVSSQGRANRVQAADRAVHDWYRFILSFPPHLVREYLARFEVDGSQRVLDPFCGTGTTLVECKRRGIPSVGIEANPMAHFASRVKVDWTPDPDGLLEHSREVAGAVFQELAAEGVPNEPILCADSPIPSPLRTLPEEQQRLLLAGSISPLPLHKVLTLLAVLERRRDLRYAGHERLALAKTVVQSASNLHFGPEIGVGPPKRDAAVVSSWLANVAVMAEDLRRLRGAAAAPSEVHQADARAPQMVLEPKSIDAVVTSPPYPNEKEYTRATRLESVLLGFIRNSAELRELKKRLVRSNTRGVYKGDDDDRWVAGHPEIDHVAGAIEARRLELGKTSGFERLYARVARLYFGGMARHLAGMRVVLRPGARLAYVVGDQASYLRVMIRTGQVLAGLAHSLGYEVVGIDLFRTRLATATREQLREEVVVLRWPGR